MPDRIPLTPDSIAEKQARIGQLFAQQCEHGRQSTRLPADQAACGQFLNDLHSEHFGLHGTAAAIFVCASEGNTILTRRLIAFVDSYYLNTETPNQTAIGEDATRRSVDIINVVKTSELLYALAVVPPASSPTSLIATLSDRLEDGMVHDTGWGYFMDSTEPEVLPTVYAVRALTRAGRPPHQAIAYLDQQLAVPPSRQSDVFVQAAALFVLTGIADGSGARARAMRSALARTWRLLEPLFRQDLESNIEYTRGHHQYYVRIPWQLYLLAAARRLSPLRRFSSFLSQRKLTAVLSAIGTPEGLIYPHSGNRVSSRTNAIAYDVLGAIRSMPAIRYWRPFYWLDRARRLFGSRVAAFLYAVVALVIGIAALLDWLTSGDASFAGIAPDLLAACLLFLAAAAKSRV